MSTYEAINTYLNEKRTILDSFPVATVVSLADEVFRTYDQGGTIYAMGNGGNAATLDHAYCDFTHHPFVTEDKSQPLPAGLKRLRFVNLSGSPAELSGLVNDLGPEHMYAAALEPVVTPDDLVMAYSGSGNSPNVVMGLRVAAKAGARSFAMTRGDGGECRTLADICLVVSGSSRFPGQTGKNDNNFHFEDWMLSLNHMLVGLLKARVSSQLPAIEAGHPSRAR